MSSFGASKEKFSRSITSTVSAHKSEQASDHSKNQTACGHSSLISSCENLNPLECASARVDSSRTGDPNSHARSSTAKKCHPTEIPVSSAYILDTYVLHPRVHARKSLFRDFISLTHPSFRFPDIGIIAPNSWISICSADANGNVRTLLQKYLVYHFLAVCRPHRRAQRQHNILLRPVISLNNLDL